MYSVYMNSLENTQKTHKEAQRVLLDGHALRKQIEGIKRSMEDSVSKEIAAERQLAESEIVSSLKILDQEQKLLVENQNLDGETFAKKLDIFGVNYKKVIGHLARKYGMAIVDEIIKRQQPDAQTIED